MSKTIEENKLTVMTNRLLCEFQYWKFICTDENMNKTKLPPPSTPVTVFLIAEKLLSLWL